MVSSALAGPGGADGEDGGDHDEADAEDEGGDEDFEQGEGAWGVVNSEF